MKVSPISATFTLFNYNSFTAAQLQNLGQLMKKFKNN